MENLFVYFLIFAIGLVSGIFICKLLSSKPDSLPEMPTESAFATMSYIINDGDFDKHLYAVGKSPSSGKYYVAAYPINTNGQSADVAFAELSKGVSFNVAPASGGKVSIVLASSSEVVMHTRQAKEIKLDAGTAFNTASGTVTGKDAANTTITVGIGRVIYVKGNERTGIVIGYVDLNDIGITP